MRRVSAALILLSAAQAASAQSTIRVRVLDSTSRPLAGTALTVMRGVSDVLATAVTGLEGTRDLAVPAGSREVEVVARRLGYAPARRLLTVRPGDTARVTLVLARAQARLDTVRVTAAERPGRNRRVVEADDIAAFKRPLADAIDVIEKMRQSMTDEPADMAGNCQPVKNLWINGRRVEWIMDRRYDTYVIRPADRARLKGPLRQVTGKLIEVLRSIRPEHIESLEYQNCIKNTVDRMGGTSALFVTLKNGVAWDGRRGSYVLGAPGADSLLDRIVLAGRRAELTSASAQAPPATVAADALQVAPAWRSRVVGVFDRDSGAALDSVRIRDLGTGNSVLTTETGTASLAFLAEGPAVLEVARPGFRADTLRVAIAASDSLPVTVLLQRAPR